MTHRIVILGAGYGGIVVANRLAGFLPPTKYQITLINAEPHFVERVRLHQIATNQEIAPYVIHDMVRGTNVDVCIGTVTELDTDAKRLSLESEGNQTQLKWDTLVYALGSGADPSGRVPGQENAFVVQHRPGAEALRSHLTTMRPGDQAVIVGGGLTGVEMASELAESRPDLRVHLVSENETGYWLSQRGQRYLNKVFSKLNIDTTSHAAVTEIGPDSVTLATGEKLTSAATVWTAGFGIHHLAAKAGIDTTEQGRIRVGPDLRSLSHPDVYAVGDAASWTISKNNLEVPMACGTAVPMAVIAARSIALNLNETSRRPAQLRTDYLLQHISLGRRRGIVQTNNYSNHKPTLVATGRYAAWQKERVIRGATWFIQRPRTFARRTKWASKVANFDLARRD